MLDVNGERVTLPERLREASLLAARRVSGEGERVDSRVSQGCADLEYRSQKLPGPSRVKPASLLSLENLAELRCGSWSF